MTENCSDQNRSDQGSVLIVDDNPLILNVVKSLLKSQSYEVFGSSNGKEALDVLHNKKIDVIICDVMMPQMDGYEFHQAIRSKPEFSHIPFIFLTALDDEGEIHHGKEIGADDYIAKPFDPKALLSIVKGKLLRSRSLKNLGEERYDSYRKKVIHTLSHEFRTPLVAINTGTELLIQQQEKLDIEKTQKLLEAIRRGGQRLERLVNDFMLLQQIEAGIAKRLFDTRGAKKELYAVVEGFFESQRERLEREGFTLSVFDKSGGLSVHIYEPQIQDILGRFLSNAMKFKADKLNIEVHVLRLESEVVIEVRDRGIGIDPVRVKEAVDVFGQIDREKLEQQGGGLGLAIASRYAGINKGRIEFDRRQGGGSVVSLILPVAK